MNTQGHLFQSSIGKKVIMSLTGLFLCVFLIVHLSGNLQLLADDNGKSFNIYSEFMGHNIFIKIFAYINYIMILAHVVYSIILTRANNKARPVNYGMNNPSANSIWASRNMGILGTLVLTFIVIHMSNFWYEFKYGEIPVIAYDNGDGTILTIKNYYANVAAAFSQGWYVALYVFSMAAIAFHLSHGFQSAFRTLGMNHHKYTPGIMMAGNIFSIVIPAGYAWIPLYFFFFM